MSSSMTGNEPMLSSTPGGPMPVWMDDTHIDPAWITKSTSFECSKAVAEDISNKSKRPKTTIRLTVYPPNDNKSNDTTPSPPISLVIKQISNIDNDQQQMRLSAYLGLAREALFFKHLGPSLPSSCCVPRVYYSYGDMETGSKAIIMEDLSKDEYVDSGLLFGPGNPNNWHRDCAAAVAKARAVPPAIVAETTFVAMAEIHARFWKHCKLLEYDWLRGQAWIQGKGRESWEESLAIVRNSWKAYLRYEQQQENGHPRKRIEWNPAVRAAVVKAVEGISWEAQMERLNTTRSMWTLVHGDCWPGNVLWKTMESSNANGGNEKHGSLRLLDWEMVGVGSGPQELGQYILSNMDPEERRSCERHLLERYLEELHRHGLADVTWEYCWREYRVGGVERWLWFLVYFVGQQDENLGVEWAQFFHNQIAAFMLDHGLTADDITQPRP